MSDHVLPDLNDESYPVIKEAHAKLTEALDAVPPERRTEPVWAGLEDFHAVMGAALERYETRPDPSDPRGSE